MEFQFIIPVTNSDLLNSDKNNYFVSRLYDANEITDKLRDAKRSIASGDHFAIFDHFDTFFSIIENAKNIQKGSMTRASDHLYQAIDFLGKFLGELLTHNDIADADRSPALNATKMLVYASIGLVKVVDQAILAANDGVVKKSKKFLNNDDEFNDWDEKRFRCLVQLYNLIQLPLEKLWDPPVPEESFVNLIGDIAYRTLEQAYVRLDKVANTAFQIFGTMIKRYNHALTFPVRILQVLKSSDLSIAPIANGIVLLYEEFNIQTIFRVIIKEMIEILSMDAADAQTAKYFSMFLMEMSNAAPKLLMPHLSAIGDELLNAESHVLRNAVFQIIGDVIISELTTEELTDDLRDTRDEFLEDLLNHMMDVSAHCRSKVLQIWLHLKANNAVPLAWQYKVLHEAVERLEDKTSLVRKNAIALLKAFLEHNPFSGKLTLEELRVKYDEENEKLQLLRTKMVEQEKRLADTETKWEDIALDLLPIIVAMVQEGVDDETMEKETGGDLVNRVSVLMAEQKYNEAVLLVKMADSTIENSEMKMLSEEEQCGFYMALLKSYYLLAAKMIDYHEEFTQLEGTVNFLLDCIDFAELISNAIPKLQELLMSKTNTDVFETIDLFTTAYMFGIKGTECGMRQMLFLVWSPDKEKRDSVVDAYKRVLFTTDMTERAHAVKVVQNLCSFIENLTAGQFSAMEVLVHEWTKDGVITDPMIQVMFQIYTKRLENITHNQSRLALQMLTLCAVAKPTIVSANQTLLETFGFENDGIKDPRIFSATLQLFMNSIVKDTENVSKYYRRYDPFETPMVQKIVTAYEKLFFAPKLEDFDDITTKTFNFIYRMCLTPDIQVQTIILTIYERLQSISDSLQARARGDGGQLSQPTQSDVLTPQLVGRESQASNATQGTTIGGGQTPLVLPTFLLTRLVFVIGYTAMKEMIYLDIDVYSNLKYRQDLKEEKKNLRKTAHNISRASAVNVSVNKRKTMSLDQSASASASKAGYKKRLSGQQEQDQDEQMVGATAEDSIAEQINFICENEMLYSRDTLFNKFIPLIREICKFHGKYKDHLLQQAATLSLIRLMSVSSKFCEENMPFLMSIFTHTKNVNIKCNIVIGLSDFTFRFPNVIEPWTCHLYATLHEQNNDLRLTAVKMLSHLILHEMIRVKGQISDLAMCIVDPEEEIRTMTQQFFKEIAHKSNILYNVLPDIISRLSDMQLNLEEDKYRIIMKYIISLIQKDRQVESLVEKLCQRFKVTFHERQWRDIAYCLTLLTYTEKTMKKMVDLIGNFKDKVQVQEVYDAFKLIISNTSKLAKPELKAAVTEFETRLNECFAVNDGEIVPAINQTSSPEAGTATDDAHNFKRPKPKQFVLKKGRRIVPPPKGPPKRSGRNTPAAKKKVTSDSESSSSSESSESSEEEENQKPRRSQAANTSSASTSRQKKTTKVIESDTSTDESDSRPQAKRQSRRR